MTNHKKCTMGIMILLSLSLAGFARADISSKHTIGETVAEFAAMDSCHKSNKHTWTCNALISAEQGNRTKVEKRGSWSAVLDGGKLVYYDERIKK